MRKRKIISIIFYRKDKNKQEVVNILKTIKNITFTKNKILSVDGDYIINIRPKHRFKRFTITYNSKKGYKTVKGIAK